MAKGKDLRTLAEIFREQDEKITRGCVAELEDISSELLAMKLRNQQEATLIASLINRVRNLAQEGKGK